MHTGRGGGAGGAGVMFAPGAVVKGTLLSLGVALLASLLLSLVITLASWDPFPSYLEAFHYISIGLGGVLAAKHARTLGWLHGGIVGVIYTVFMAFLFTDGMSFSALLQPEWLLNLLWGFVAGVIGGVLGVNA